MNLLNNFYAFVTALCAALLMVPFLRNWALERGTVDVPDARKVHDTPTPRLGGIAIFLAFLFAALIYAPSGGAFRGLLAGALVVFATGIADDLQGLTSRQKFLGQIVACLVTIAVGSLWLHDLGDLFGFGAIALPAWAGIPFTVFAVVGVCNAINLIDGLDGLAGGVSVLALLAFAVLGLLHDDRLTALLAVAMAGAILGFLKYNFYPARIFMGDTGSLTVGFVLGFLAVHLTQQGERQVSPMLPVLILGLPIFDALWVMVRRLAHRLSPFAPDRSHVHHKFLDLGFEHRFTVVTIYAISLFWVCSALLLQHLPEYLLLLFLIGTAGGFYLLLRHLLNHRERYPFLKRDDIGAIRASVTFGRCADLADHLLTPLAVLLGLYALLGVEAAVVHGLPVWPVALALLAIGAVLRFRGSDGGGDFMLLLTYAAACLLAFTVWRHGNMTHFDISPKRLGDGLLLAAALMVGLKILFRRPGEFFLGSADFLTLALLIFLAVAAQQPEQLGLNLGGPLVRAILLILVVRTVASRGRTQQRRLVDVSLLLLALFAVAGMLNQ